MAGKSSHEQNHDSEASCARASAINLMGRALTILDYVGPLHAAATLALAIEQAGGTVPSPPSC